jgi:hypothetical protein
MSRRRRRPGVRRGRVQRCRLVSVAWLVEEDRVHEIVALAQAAGFAVTVAPTVHVVAEGSVASVRVPLAGAPAPVSSGTVMRGGESVSAFPGS